MKIDGKAYCLFEQSGTFRDAFKRAGIPAICVDIDNKDGQTDYIVDLFEAIEQAYYGKPSFLDRITPDDFVMAFFPCIHFCQFAVMFYKKEAYNKRKQSPRNKADYAMRKFEQCYKFYCLLTKLCTIAQERNWRLVVENPWKQSLMQILWKKPEWLDKDRSMYGDYFHKPTGYWFYGCKPEIGVGCIKKNKNTLIIEKTKKGAEAEMCSLDRSRISPTYADNFVRCKILGNDCTEKLENQQITLF